MIALQISAAPRLPICRNPSTLTTKTLKIKSFRLVRERTGFLKLASAAKGRRKYGSMVVRANKGGGGNWETDSTVRALGNLAVASGLAYLTLTGQLGWVLDAIVSIWVRASSPLYLELECRTSASLSTSRFQTICSGILVIFELRGLFNIYISLSSLHCVLQVYQVISISH